METSSSESQMTDGVAVNIPIPFSRTTNPTIPANRQFKIGLFFSQNDWMRIRADADPKKWPNNNPYSDAIWVADVSINGTKATVYDMLIPYEGERTLSKTVRIAHECVHIIQFYNYFITQKDRDESAVNLIPFGDAPELEVDAYIMTDLLTVVLKSYDEYHLKYGKA